MKKIFLCVLLFTTILTISNQQTLKANNILEVPKTKVNINSQAFKSKESIINLNGRLLLPFREIFNALGVEDDSIFWDGSKREVRAITSDKEIKLSIGSNKVYLDDEMIEIDTNAVIYNDRTYIPLRFVAQSMGKVVTWDDKTKTASIMDEESYDEIRVLLDEVVKNQLRKIKEVKVNFQIKSSSRSDTNVFTNIVYVGESIVDTSNKIAYTKINASLMGVPNLVEYYIMDLNKYKFNKQTDSWNMTSISEENKNEIFNGYGMYSAFNILLEDELVSALDIKENETEYILTGNTVIESLTKLISLSEGNSVDTFNSERIGIVIDKTQKTIKSLNMKADKDIAIDGKNVNIRLESNYDISEYNGNLQNEIPKF